MGDLTKRHCEPCHGGVKKLDPITVREMLRELDGWSVEEDYLEISRDFQFGDFHETMAFVNALAWVAHREDHHPDLEIGYSHCLVRWSTHAIRGLSENDFICAAKVNELLAEKERAPGSGLAPRG